VGTEAVRVTPATLAVMHWALDGTNATKSPRSLVTPAIGRRPSPQRSLMGQPGTGLPCRSLVLTVTANGGRASSTALRCAGAVSISTIKGAGVSVARQVLNKKRFMLWVTAARVPRNCAVIALASTARRRVVFDFAPEGTQRSISRTQLAPRGPHAVSTEILSDQVSLEHRCSDPRAMIDLTC
jgi:hypothetical protein